MAGNVKSYWNVVEHYQPRLNTGVIETNIFNESL